MTELSRDSGKNPGAPVFDGYKEMTALTKKGSSAGGSKNGMNERAWKARVMVRYALLQLPALVLLGVILVVARRWVDLPSWFVWCLISLWIAKDLCLYPFVWRAYDHGRPGEANSMAGAHGIAVDRLHKSP